MPDKPKLVKVTLDNYEAAVDMVMASQDTDHIMAYQECLNSGVGPGPMLIEKSGDWVGLLFNVLTRGNRICNLYAHLESVMWVQRGSYSTILNEYARACLKLPEVEKLTIDTTSRLITAIAANLGYTTEGVLRGEGVNGGPRYYLGLLRSEFNG